MKKILVVAAFMLSGVGSAHAAFLDGILGDDKYTIREFGSNDIFLSQASGNNTSGEFTDVAPLSTGSPPLSVEDSSGFSAGFVFDYTFSAVQDTFVSIAGSLQLTTAAVIDPLLMQVWGVTEGMWLVEEFISTDGTRTDANFNMSATQDYIVRMSNPGGTIDPGANYSLTVTSAVPVPAAIWLFGTAIVGFLGLRRKGKAGLPA